MLWTRRGRHASGPPHAVVQTAVRMPELCLPALREKKLLLVLLPVPLRCCLVRLLPLLTADSFVVGHLGRLALRFDLLLVPLAGTHPAPHPQRRISTAMVAPHLANVTNRCRGASAINCHSAWKHHCG